MVRKLLLLITLFAFTQFGFSQLVVNNTGNNGSPSYLVQNVLVGQGIIVSNISFTGDSSFQIGFFNGVASNIGLDSGIVLSSGNVGLAPGPNNSGSAGLSVATGNNGDADLTALAGVNTFDAAVLQFDFVPTGDTARFRYVFGSEEYNEFVCGSVNDAFGFFISGPGINGPFTNNAVNIALIPNTTVPVSINTVNIGTSGGGSGCPTGGLSNSAYFVNNPGGATVQYDGFTVVLEAKYPVQCGQTYHLKLAISDGGDHVYDSGVFLEANSLTSDFIDVTLKNNATGGSSVAEGCTNAEIEFIRPDTTGTMIYHFTIGGNAINGTDYTFLADSIIFNSGDSIVTLNFNPIADGITEGIDTISITIMNISICGDTIYKTAYLYIYDEYTISLSSSADTITCQLDNITISGATNNGLAPFVYNWSTGQTTSSISVSPNVSTWYPVTVSDYNGCVDTDSVYIYVANLVFPVFAGNDTMICDIDSITIGGSPTAPVGSTFGWTGPIIGSTNVANPTISPNINSTYVVTATNPSTGCFYKDTMVVEVKPNPAYTLNSTLNPVCIGEVTQLNVEFTNTIPASCGLAPNGCNSTPTITQIGVGAASNTGTTYPAPYGNWFWGARHQFLFTAAELNAQGMIGGILSSLQFNVLNIPGTASHQGYTIKMGCTSATSLSGAFLTGLQTVFAPTNIIVVPGWNTHTFTTPYAWDGVSNLVVEVCFNNSSFTQNVVVQQSTTTFNSSQYYFADQAGVCAGSGFITATTMRPNVKFGYCTAASPTAFNYQWSTVSGNGILSNPTNIINPMAAVPNTSTFSVTVTDTFGVCVSSQTIQINTTTQYTGYIDSIGPFCFGDANTYNLTGNWPPNVPIIWYGPGVVNPGVSPNFIGGFQPINANGGFNEIGMVIGQGSNCQNTILDTIFVIPPFDVSIQDPGPICVSGGTVQLTSADPNVTGTGVWAGNGITPQGLFNPAIQGVGSFPVYYTQSQPCIQKDTFYVNVVPTFNAGFTMPVAICEYASPINLIPDSVGGSFSGSGIVGATFNPGLAGPGIHYITYADNNTLCPSQLTKPINVIATPVPNMAILNPFIGPWCEGYDTTNFSNLPTPYPQGPGVSSSWGHGLGSNLTDTSSLGNVFVNFNIKNLTPGSHTLIYYVTVTNAGVGCSALDSIDIVILPRPLAPSFTSTSPYCLGESISDITAIADSSIFSINWYADSTNQGLQNWVYTGNPLDYYFGLPANEPYGSFDFWVTQAYPVATGLCESDGTPVFIEIYESPTADYTADSMQGKEPLEVHFTNLSTPTTMQTYAWTFEPGASSTDFEPVYVFENYGTFITQLIVTNPIGCTDTARLVIQVDVSFEVVYPVVFSPNGDGVNDLFDMKVNGVQEFECIVRDRWGKVVHSWTSNDNSWNGKRHNGGADCDEGVYFWTLHAVKVDGASQYEDHGTITLLRGK